MNTILLRWHGPFSLAEITNGRQGATKQIEACGGNGLYAVTGKTKGQRLSRLQYIGITEQKYRARFYDKNHKVYSVSREQKIWLGKIAFGETDRKLLELAESMLIYFNDEVDILNEKKVFSPPKQSCALISAFFKKDTGEPYVRLPAIVRMLPEVLVWDKESSILRYKEKLNFLYM